MPKVDMSGIEPLTAMEAGQYPATLTSFEYHEAAASSGKPFYSLEFTISEGEYNGRKAWRNFSLQQQALWALQRAAIRLGADPDDVQGEVDMDEVLASLVGSECVLDIGVREYEGEDRNEIKAIRPARGALAGAGGGERSPF